MKLYKIILFLTLITFCFMGSVKAQEVEKIALSNAIGSAKEVLDKHKDSKAKNTIGDSVMLYQNGNECLKEIEEALKNSTKKHSSDEVGKWTKCLNFVISTNAKQNPPKNMEGTLQTVIDRLKEWDKKARKSQDNKNQTVTTGNTTSDTKDEKTELDPLESLGVVGEQIKTLQAEKNSLDTLNKLSNSLLLKKDDTIKSLKESLSKANPIGELSPLGKGIDLKNIAISAAISLLVGLLLGGLLFYFTLHKKEKNRLVVENANLSDEITNMKRNQLKSQDELIEDNRKLNELLNQEKAAKEKNKQNYENQLNDLERQLEDAKKSRTQQISSSVAPVVTAPVKTVSVPTVSSSRHFWAETLMTAGPRKNFGQSANDADFGLGEDTAGVIVKHQHCFFWVLDGTSDANILKTQNSKNPREYFSSRLLAQTISWNIHTAIEECGNYGYNAASILERAIVLTYEDWNTNLAKLTQEDKDYISYLLNKQTMLQCSTTALFGILDINGRLDVCRVGDSKFIALPNKPQQGKASGRQYITLKNENNVPSLDFTSFENTRYTTEVLENVDSVLAMTDGVSNTMDAWLSKIPNSNFSNENVRKALANFKQGTNDDKALCIIQIKG